MSDYLKLLDKGADLIGLKDDLDLIRSLLALKDQWSKQDVEIRGATTAEDLLAKLIANVDDASVKTAIEKTGSAELIAIHGKLAGLLKKVKAAADKVPKEIKLLLDPISTYNAPAATKDGAISWTPIDKTEKFGEGGDFTFEIGGSAKLSLAAGDKVKIGETEKKLLKIGAELGVHAKAGGTAPFKPIKVGGKFEASGGATLTYHFDPAGDPLYGFALAERLPALPNPFDYDAIWRAFASRKLGLARLSYGVKGRTKANVELSVGNKLSFGKDLVADLALSFSADFSLEADYTLTLSAGAPLGAADGDVAPREIGASLMRRKLTEEALALALKVDVDLSSLAKRIQTEAQKAVDKWDSLLKQIRPFLSPGTLIQKELSDRLGAGLEALIKDKGLRDAVTRDLRSVIGVDPDKDPDLVKWLREQVTGAIDSARGAITDRTDATIERVLGRLGDKFAAFAEPAVRDKLKPMIATLLDGAEEQLTALVERLLKEPNEALRKALKAVGVKAADAVATLDKAVASVRKVIDRFDTAIQDAMKTLQDGAKMHITAGLLAEERRRDEETMEIVGTFTANGKPAAKVFHALTRGRPSDLRPLLASDVPGDDFRLDLDRSKLTLYSKRTSKIGWQVMAFGFGASGHTIAEGDAKVTLDGRGGVEVDSSAKIEAEFTGPRETRKVTLVEGFDLLLARIEGAQVDKLRAIDFGVSITHEDKSLKLGEMRGFMESLQKHGLLPADVATRAKEHFVRWTGKDEDDAKLPADIAARLYLNLGQVKELLMLNRRDQGKLRADAAADIIAKAVTALLATDAFVNMGAGRFEKAVRFVQREFYPSNYPAGTALGKVLYDMREKAPGVLASSWKDEHRLPSDGPPDRGEDIKRLLRSIRLQLHALVDLIDIMGQIYLAQPETLGEESPLGWNQKTYADKQLELANSGRGWIKTGGKLLFWIDRDVQPWTVSLLWVVAELARGSRANAMSLTLTRRASGNVQAETVELAKAG